jgi:hypothetical protein
MRLISPKEMDEKQERALRLCLKDLKLSFSRSELKAVISEGMANIEEGVRIIDQDMPVPSLGAVDLVAEDVRGRLVLITFAVNVDPDALGNSLIRADWALHSLDLLGHMYSRDFPQEVRSWHMVESVTAEAASLLSRMEHSPVEVFICEGVDLGEEKWLVVRRYDAQEALREALSPKAKPQHAPSLDSVGSVVRNPREEGSGAAGTGRARSVLTREEIDDFFDSSVYGEEVTS